MQSIYFRFGAPRGDDDERSFALERLLACADAGVAVSDWRADAFRGIAAVDSPPPAPAPALLCAAGGGIADGAAALATPVHCVAGMSRVRLDPDGLPELDAGTAATLAEDFNRVFAGGGERLIATPAGALLCVFERPLQCVTVDPERLRGRDIAAYLPTGTDGALLRGLMSEIEMWLFEHRVNRSRLAAGQAPVTGLWLWGEGAPLAALPPLTGWTAGKDPLFSAWPGRAPGGDLGSSGVLAWESVRPGSAGWDALERDWLMPSLAALHSGRIARLELSAGLTRHRITALARWRFWRRARPWWTYFDDGCDGDEGE